MDSASVESRRAAKKPRRELDDKINGKIGRSGVEAARRKFTPEFINRLDKIVVFQPLGSRAIAQDPGHRTEPRPATDLQTAHEQAIRFHGHRASKDYLLSEGTDLKYGARHLKRAIERLLVHPLSNLIATEQVRGGDWIRVDCDRSCSSLTFFKDAENMPFSSIAKMLDLSMVTSPPKLSARAIAHPPDATSTRSSRRGSGPVPEI